MGTLSTCLLSATIFLTGVSSSSDSSADSDSSLSLDSLSELSDFPTLPFPCVLSSSDLSDSDSDSDESLSSSDEPLDDDSEDPSLSDSAINITYNSIFLLPLKTALRC